MYVRLSAGALSLALLMAAGAMSSRSAYSQETRRKVTPMRSDQQSVNRILSGWMEMPREAAHKLISKYGLPHEATPTQLVWHNSGPWKITVLRNEMIPHDFPKPHHDMLEQRIDYRVPAEKFDDLARFDGSVIVDRTKGEIAARCDKEAMNFVALNLADDVVKDKRSIEAAREFYAEIAIQKKHPKYTEGFLFTVPSTGTGFSDHPVEP